MEPYNPNTQGPKERWWFDYHKTSIKIELRHGMGVGDFGSASPNQGSGWGTLGGWFDRGHCPTWTQLSVPHPHPNQEKMTVAPAKNRSMSVSQSPMGPSPSCCWHIYAKVTRSSPWRIPTLPSICSCNPGRASPSLMSHSFSFGSRLVICSTCRCFIPTLGNWLGFLLQPEKVPLATHTKVPLATHTNWGLVFSHTFLPHI